ncbi:MAG: hypothetical protein ABIK09_09730 [Pseudomonadota bacterium]
MTGPVALLVLLSNLVASWGLPPALVSRGDLDVLAARLDATIEENIARHCPRPVIGGAPIPGPAAHDIVLVAEGGAGLHDCYDFLAQYGAVLFGPPVDDGERQTGLVNQFTEICRSLPEALRSATSHADACSPYQPGRRGIPDLQVTMTALAAARRFGAMAVLGGQPAAAAQRFLDVLRFSQDLGRGGAPLVLTMFGTSVMREVIMNDLAQLIERPEVEVEDLEGIASALDQLILSEPSLPRIIAADTTWLAVEAGLPLIRGPGWAPPGGFSQGRRRTPTDDAPDLLPWIPQSRERGIIFSAFMELDRKRRAACPLNATLADCHAGLLALSEARQLMESTPSWIRWLRVALAPAPLAALRRELEERVQARVDAPFEGYVREYASRSFQMTILRFLVAVRLELRRSGRCPTSEDLEAPRWQEILRDPVFGGGLGATRRDPVSYVVESNGRFTTGTGGGTPLRLSASVPACEGR